VKNTRSNPRGARPAFVGSAIGPKGCQGIDMWPRIFL
jgi:hypothetical protein